MNTPILSTYKLYLLLCLTGLTVAMPALAQKEARAQAVLDAMSKKYSALKSFQAAFTYTSAGGGASESYTGEMTAKGNKFRLKMSGQEVYNDSKTMATYVKETNEVNLQDYDASAAGELNPTRIFTIYKKGYNYRFLREQKQAGRTLEVVELTPEKKNTQVVKLQITVDKADRSVKNWQITDKSGKVTTFQISKFVANAPAPDALFTFDKSKYPGVEVVDLR
jgi:outer membrane lipoprotein-sorting protein